jgi:hypothetical protein
MLVKKAVKICGIAVLMLFSSVSVAGDDFTYNGNELIKYLPGAIDGVDKGTRWNIAEATAFGYVFGAWESLNHVDATCVPSDVIAVQVARVVYNYLKSNPDKLHMNASTLTLEALSQAWPCSKN